MDGARSGSNRFGGWKPTALAVALALFCAPAVEAAGRVGDAAPGCALQLGGARAADLRQYRGKVVYVDFWASWCASCLLSFPFLSGLDSTYAARGLQVVAINMDQKPADASRFLARHPTRFAVALGDNQKCARAFGVEAMPSSFVIDRRGVIRVLNQGFRPGEGKPLSTSVERLLSEPAPGA
jgi:thiol-disulfide isomerase/thioredoxin